MEDVIVGKHDLDREFEHTMPPTRYSGECCTLLGSDDNIGTLPGKLPPVSSIILSPFFCPLRVATTQSMQINTTRARPHYYLSKCLFSVLFSALPKAADWRRSVHVSRHWPPRRVNIDRNNHLQWALLFMIALYTELLLLLLLVLVVAMIMLSASFFPHQIQILT